MNKDPIHIVFAGGGTAGHIFPGIAVAENLAARRSAPRMTLIGSGKPIESRIAKQAGLEYLALPAAPLSRGVRGLIRFLSENLAGYRAAKQFLRDEHADVVVGLGGYASVPICRAAVTLGIPLVLLEQNVFPGKATRWLARRANLVCTAFDKTRDYLRSTDSVYVTGNPIRSGFRRSRRKSASRRPRLLVLGGSGGARSLNEAVPRVIHSLHDSLNGWQIVHQTGAADARGTKQLYRELGIQALVVPFVQNLPQVLRRSELVISRAGGTTLAELAATGVPALLIPYPHAAGDHQRLNAEVFTSADAARLVDERKLDVPFNEALATSLAELITGADLRASMSSAMLKLARPEATLQVAAAIGDLAKQSTNRLPIRAA
jgi:UDP-N-acetylglucosamine--N-acetylmuramyl-(pentapeptide) pyrophosphoryl-undecaprenol N-acetylglucosamine transferase